MRQHLVLSPHALAQRSQMCDPMAQTANFQLYVDLTAQDRADPTVAQKVQGHAFCLGVSKLPTQAEIRYPLSAHLSVQQVFQL